MKNFFEQATPFPSPEIPETTGDPSLDKVLRLSKPEEAQAIIKRWSELSPEEKTQILEELTQQ